MMGPLLILSILSTAGGMRIAHWEGLASSTSLINVASSTTSLQPYVTQLTKRGAESGFPGFEQPSPAFGWQWFTIGQLTLPWFGPIKPSPTVFPGHHEPSIYPFPTSFPFPPGYGPHSAITEYGTSNLFTFSATSEPSQVTSQKPSTVSELSSILESTATTSTPLTVSLRPPRSTESATQTSKSPGNSSTVSNTNSLVGTLVSSSTNIFTSGSSSSTTPSASSVATGVTSSSTFATSSGTVTPSSSDTVIGGLPQPSTGSIVLSSANSIVTSDTIHSSSSLTASIISTSSQVTDSADTSSSIHSDLSTGTFTSSDTPTSVRTENPTGSMIGGSTLISGQTSAPSDSSTALLSSSGPSMITTRVTTTGAEGDTTLLSETLTPETTTNSVGQTVTSLLQSLTPSSTATSPFSSSGSNLSSATTTFGSTTSGILTSNNPSITTITSVGTDGITSTQVESLSALTTVNSLGSTATSLVPVSLSGTFTTSSASGQFVTTYTSVGTNGVASTGIETLSSAISTDSLGSAVTSLATVGTNNSASVSRTSSRGSLIVTASVTTGTNGVISTLTETLSPITSTNSLGSTFVSTGTFSSNPSTGLTSSTLTSAQPSGTSLGTSSGTTSGTISYTSSATSTGTASQKSSTTNTGPSSGTPSSTASANSSGTSSKTTSRASAETSSGVSTGTSSTESSTATFSRSSNSSDSTSSRTSTRLSSITTTAGSHTGSLIVTTYTFTGSDGQTSTLVETLEPVTTTNSVGSTITSTSVLLPTLPSGATVVTTSAKETGGSIITFPEILQPTTTTDSTGEFIVGTITRGPEPPPPTGSLSTYSSWPPGLTFVSTSVASNTHDSSGHPIFGPWPGCFFCPPGSHGIEVGGASIAPGVYPGPQPPAPGLPGPWPPVTIKPDGTPEYTSSPTSPSPSSTPTSSCTTTETMTDITYVVSFATNTAGSTTATSTISTASLVTRGCSVRATTVTSTTKGGSASSTYYVFPADPTNSATNANIVSAINKASSEPDIQFLGSPETGIQYYIATLPEDSIQSLSTVSGVEYIGQLPSPCTGNACVTFEYDGVKKRSPGNKWTTKKDLPNSKQLSFISQPQGVTSRTRRPPNYNFRQNPGENIYVYIVDSGADLKNPQFSNLVTRLGQNNIQFAGPDWPAAQPGTDPSGIKFPDPVRGESSTIYHGSEMLSMLVGNDVGVADAVKPVIVRYGQGSNNVISIEQQYEEFISILIYILRDWRAKRAADATLLFGVVNLSWELNLPGGVKFKISEYKPYQGKGDSKQWARGIFRDIVSLMKQCANEGLIFTTSGGNAEGDPEGLVACLSSSTFTWDTVSNSGPAGLDDAIVVVGSVNAADGSLDTARASGDLVNIYAPGKNLWAAARGTSNGLSVTNTVSGTSHACAITSGILAYLASNEQDGVNLLSSNDLRGNVRGIRNLLLQSAWRRSDGFPLAIYNRAPKDCSNNSKLKRQDGDSSGEDSVDPNYCELVASEEASTQSTQSATPTTISTVPRTSAASSTPQSTITQAPLISCSSNGPEPENGIVSGFCVCSSSTFSQHVTTVSGSVNSCGYTSLPSQTINPVRSSSTPPPAPTTASSSGPSTTYSSVTSNPTSSTNDCGPSTFIDQTSDASPLAVDCIRIAVNIKNDGSWETSDVISGHQRQIVQYGTCAINVSGKGTTDPPDTGFVVGNADLVDIINESVARFTNAEGKVGSKGVMQCQGEVVVNTQDVQVTWGMYHT